MLIVRLYHSSYNYLYGRLNCNSQWTWTGERNSKRIRELYLKAVLRQDIAFFDKLGAGEVATRIQTDTRQFPCLFHLPQRKRSFLTRFLCALFRADLIQQGISEKVALCAQFLGAFATGFICTLDPPLVALHKTLVLTPPCCPCPVAYARSWRLALAMTSILPCIAITGGIMQQFVSKYMRSVAVQLRSERVLGTTDDPIIVPPLVRAPFSLHPAPMQRVSSEYCRRWFIRRRSHLNDQNRSGT